jgi:tetratricopeptide (TPR) repeat protein
MMTCQLFLAAALLAPAQEPTRPASAYDGLLLTTRAPGPRPVDEQIEVMRALLIRKLGGGGSGAARHLAEFLNADALRDVQAVASSPGGPAYGAGMSGYRAVTTLAEPAVEGTYLDGYGVVFTVTLPATGRDPRPATTGPKDGPALSEWDREQRRLHGEPLPEKTSATPAQPAVGDILLKLLAENGKHFSALKDDERIAVAVTFRGVSPPTLSGSNLSGTATLLLTPAAGPNAPGAGAAPEDKGNSLILLGDLHLKQGEPQAAIDAFRKAVAAAEREATTSPDSSDAQKSLRGTLHKLAQAYLAAGKDDEARSFMEKAAVLSGAKVVTANPAAKPAAATRPARLTVSAPKKLLDQIGNGKISLEEFRKQATVEYVSEGKGG